MSAADLLRTALAEAPAVTVEGGEESSDCLLRVEGLLLIEAAGAEERAAFRLIGLLLAAAPHLADLLDELAPCIGAHNEATRQAWSRLVVAITEAGESL